MKKVENQKNLNICQSYMDYIFFNQNYSKNTYSHYHLIIIEFLNFIDPLPLGEVTKDQFQDFFKIRKTNLKNSSKKNYIIILKNFFKYCQMFHNCELKFVNTLKTMRTDYDIKVPFSLNEIKLIFSTFEDDLVAYIIKLLYYTGLRISEAINILIEDVNLANNTIKIIGKGSRERIIFIPPILASETQRQLNNNRNFLLEINGQPLIRQTVNNLLNDFAIKRRFTFKIHPHKFRRSLATHLIELDMNIREIQVYLGHKSLASTEKYIKLSQEKLKQRVQKAFNNK